MMKRRTALAGLASIPMIRSARAQARNLNISHQFPGSNGEEGDFRDRLCRKFAADVETRTKGALTFTVYPNSSLVKTFAQIGALRKGALDIGLVPTAYGGGEIPELNITFMPAIINGYEHGLAWKKAAIGKAMTDLLDAKGIKLVSWLWQSGGIASRVGPILRPADVKGLKVRGGSKEMDELFAAAGASSSTMPSNELYIAMKTGVMDVAVTSSTSLISFRLEELSKSLTTARKGSFWFMLEPLLMSKAIFDSLPAPQQKALMDVGAEMETWAMAEAKKDDDEVARIYAAKGVQVADMTDEGLAKWRKVAEEAAWADFAAKSSESAELLKLAKQVS